MVKEIYLGPTDITQYSSSSHEFGHKEWIKFNRNNNISIIFFKVCFLFLP